MKKHRRLVTMLGLSIVGVILASTSPSVAQEETARVVYGRSTGVYDIPRHQELFLMNADGSEVMRLTDNRKEDAFPVLSPDGQRIAFSRRIRGQYDLFVINTDGSGVTRVTRTSKGDEVLPAWAPEGASLAFTVTTAIPDRG